MSRINTYPEAGSLNQDDYLLIDGATNGTRKVKADIIEKHGNSIDNIEHEIYSFNNLFRFIETTKTISGITFEFTRSGVTLNGNATAGGFIDYVFKIEDLKPLTTYTLKMFNVIGLRNNQAMYLRQGNTSVQTFSFGAGATSGPNGVTFTTPADVTGIYGRIYFNSNTGTLNNAHADIMVVEGSTVPESYIGARDLKLVTKRAFEESIEEVHDEAAGVGNFVYSTFATAVYKKTISISTSYIQASTHIFDVAISEWSYYSFTANFAAEKYAIYVNGAILFTELIPNTKYYFQATSDIEYLSIYSNTITGDHIDFELELIDYDPNKGVDSVSQKINSVEKGNIAIPYLPLVGSYTSNNNGRHTSAKEIHTGLISVSPGEQINVSLIYEDSTQTAWVTAILYDSSKEFLRLDNVNLSAVGVYIGTYTIPVGVYYISFQPAMYNGANFKISQRVDIDGFVLPPYYNVNDYIQNKVRVIANTIADAHGDYDVFIFNTDQHWRLNAKNSPKLIYHICDCIPIKKMFLGGDLDDGISLQASKAFADAFNGEIYKLIGNHEYMNYVWDLNGGGLYTEVTDALVCAYYGTGVTNVVYGDAERQYYYIDDPTRKMRYIILSVFADDGSFAKYQFESAQQTWFENTALNLQTGYTAVILTHALYLVDHETGAMTLTDPTVLQPLVNIINNYSGNGEIGCVFAGHTHFDGMTTLNSGVPVFITTCDKYKAFVSDGTDTEPWLTEDRVKGTITEQAFDVVIVDKHNKRISAIRIGAPAYNGSSEVEIRTATY